MAGDVDPYTVPDSYAPAGGYLGVSDPAAYDAYDAADAAYAAYDAADAAYAAYDAAYDAAADPVDYFAYSGYDAEANLYRVGGSTIGAELARTDAPYLAVTLSEPATAAFATKFAPETAPKDGESASTLVPLQLDSDGRWVRASELPAKPGGFQVVDGKLAPVAAASKDPAAYWDAANNQLVVNREVVQKAVADSISKQGYSVDRGALPMEVAGGVLAGRTASMNMEQPKLWKEWGLGVQGARDAKTGAVYFTPVVGQGNTTLHEGADGTTLVTITDPNAAQAAAAEFSLTKFLMSPGGAQVGVGVLTLLGSYFLAERAAENARKLERDRARTQLELLGAASDARGGGGGGGGSGGGRGRPIY